MFAVINGRILTMTGRDIERGVVLIDDGQIVAVGAEVQVPRGVDVYDATGKVVMPGLIDAHCHLGIVTEGVDPRADDSNETTDPITPHLRTLDAINPDDLGFDDLLETGITTVLTGPGSGNIIGGQWVCLKTVRKPNVQDMVLLEPAGMKIALGENPKRAHGEQKRMPSTRMGNAALLRSALVGAQNYARRWQYFEAEKAQFEKRLEEGVQDSREPVPPDRDLRNEALVKLLRREMKARVHAHRADDLLTAVRIAEEFGLDLTLEHATEGYKIADVLAAKGIPVTTGPMFLHFRKKFETRHMTAANPGILARAGVKVAIQTDSTYGLRFLTYSAALAVREGMSETDALKAITINAAEIIGVDDRVGSLAPGKDADIVVLSGHPLEYLTVTELVLVDGVVVYRRAGPTPALTWGAARGKQ